jgi:hypothetical protein
VVRKRVQSGGGGFTVSPCSVMTSVPSGGELCAEDGTM